jgi:alpha-N-acetylglucosamine transferase
MPSQIDDSLQLAQQLQQAFLSMSTINISSNSNRNTMTSQQVTPMEQPAIDPPQAAVVPGEAPIQVPKYAYAWVIGGIDHSNPSYKGFLYTILISVHLLQRYGSQADFLVLAQLSHEATGNELPTEDVKLLEALNVKIKFLGKPIKSSFAHLVYDKFRPLQYTEYSRILFLDADIVPLYNMDYLFQLSESGSLKPNVMLASRGEPCNTGVFLMHPEPGAWEELQGVIAKHHEQARKLPYPHFDKQNGWGHNHFAAGDTWEGILRNGKVWSFHAAHSDQGLWYYWGKYVKQDTSILIGNRIQHVSPGPNGQPLIVNGTLDDLAKVEPEPAVEIFGCKTAPATSRDFRCNRVYRGFAHFMGDKKPWKGQTSVGGLRLAHKYWLETLTELNKKLKMGLDMPNFFNSHALDLGMPLGGMAMYTDHMHVVHGHMHNETAENDMLEDKQETVQVKSQIAPLHDSDPRTVAYAVSVIKCGDAYNNAVGLTDSTIVLRHSIHKISRRNPSSGSKYDYKMYAIVHRDAEACTAEVLRSAGFEVMVVDPPVKQSEIRGEHLRLRIHREKCCGSDEFIKLYAYDLPHEITVHVDIDFAFFKPMDDLFDAIRFDKDSDMGQAARSRLLLENPDDVLPDKIDAFWTRDWPQVAPNKWPAGFQAGFIVARSDPTIVPQLSSIILEGNYTAGWGWNYGWGNLGYGGWWGAMAMQGLIAYFYDHVRPNTAVELNQCYFNHMGMDVLYRGEPNFRPRIPGVGGCRNGKEVCEDCMTTNIEVGKRHGRLCPVLFVSCCLYIILQWRISHLFFCGFALHMSKENLQCPLYHVS